VGMQGAQGDLGILFLEIGPLCNATTSNSWI
jgi:hypothetical protein